ncbi:PIG-L family deacetylase [Rhodopseudomonas palustris]|uniref:PIG-L family deacetylase n=1 Tax=Rhodopseudomonas palustris TaxID=1076 RepID=A0A323UP55_RHOPL|nr:PIG-L family deacetylase [Rhodopseudomonas palustris]PZA12876.1 PIG-L family deacetylase [Rhodopseudomonas palustris]
MTAADYLELVRRLPAGTLQDLTSGGAFVVLAPHPDDESLGTGGLIAAGRDAGQRVEIVLVTDGGGSHPNSRLYPRQRLVALRCGELEAAAAALGVGRNRLHALGLPDAGTPDGGPAFDAAVEAVAAICVSSGAKALFVTWDGDPHCDHQAAARIAAAVVRRLPSLALWAYPIWGWHLDPSLPLDRPKPSGLRLDIAAQLTRKRAAIAAHASQMTDLIDDDPDGFRFTTDTLAPFLGGFEHYIRLS